MRSTQRLVKDIIKEVAAETDKSYQFVEDIFYHQFEFLRDCMESGKGANVESYNNVLLKYLGTFYASENVITAIENAKIRKRQNLDNDGEEEDDDNSEVQSQDTEQEQKA